MFFMKIKYTPKFLTQVESVFTQGGYRVRYEKGNFQSGYCILNQQKVVVISKYFTLEGKINCLVEILRRVDWDFSQLEESERVFYQAIKGIGQLEIDL
jgi:hypothetical protein